MGAQNIRTGHRCRALLISSAEKQGLRKIQPPVKFFRQGSLAIRKGRAFNRPRNYQGLLRSGRECRQVISGLRATHLGGLGRRHKGEEEGEKGSMWRSAPMRLAPHYLDSEECV